MEITRSFFKIKRVDLSEDTSITLFTLHQSTQTIESRVKK